MTAAVRGAAKGEQGSAAALRWVCDLLAERRIPYQMTGDVAAIAHGAGRAVRGIELFIAAEHVPSLLRAAREHVVDYPWRRLDDHWDLVALVLAHGGVRIDVRIADAARYRDETTGVWREAAVDPAVSVTLPVGGVEVSVTPREQLLDPKRRLDREVDRQDLRRIAREGS